MKLRILPSETGFRIINIIFRSRTSNWLTESKSDGQISDCLFLCNEIILKIILFITDLFTWNIRKKTEYVRKTYYCLNFITENDGCYCLNGGHQCPLETRLFVMNFNSVGVFSKGTVLCGGCWLSMGLVRSPWSDKEVSGRGGHNSVAVPKAGKGG